MNQRQIKIVGGGGLNGRIFHKIISLENLFAAWREFRRGKQSKLDVQKFEWSLEDNLFRLHESLVINSYFPEPYQSFIISDPKPRRIHKATVRDRVLYQAIYRILYQIFDPLFIHDSYSCRQRKGVHRAVGQLGNFLRKTSHNYCCPTYVLKCDIRKFFDSINQNILINLLRQKINCFETMRLLKQIIYSFKTSPNQGLPLGNVTSQLFANIYLDELDQFVKHELKVRYYVRYCDDFLIVGLPINQLANLISLISYFLNFHLKLNLHSDKIMIRKFRQGIDYLGYISRPHYCVLRTRTKKRILKIAHRELISEASLCSYLGVLRHCRSKKIEDMFLRLCYNPRMAFTRKQKLFDPQSTEPFKLSRTKIELYLRCPLCFYLARRLGVAEPPGYPFSLNAAVDHLLKKEFDIHRAKGEPHPLMSRYGLKAVPFAHPDLDLWRENFKGVQYLHPKTNLLITGAVDDVWINENKELHVVDYKATSKDSEVSLDAEWQRSYKNQMEIYQWLLRSNNFKVSDIGYFVYVNGRRDRATFAGRLEFDIKLIPYRGATDWILAKLSEIKQCLMQSPPPANADCDFCRYRQAAGEELKKFYPPAGQVALW